MRKIILLPLILALVLVFACENAFGRGGRPVGRGGPKPVGGGGGGGGGNSGGDKDDSDPKPPVDRSAPDAPENDEEVGKADADERPKQPTDALRDELKEYADQARKDCADVSTRRLMRRVFRGAQGETNRKAGACPVPEHPAKEEKPEGVPEADPGVKPGEDPGEKPGDDPGVKPGENPEEDPGVKPDAPEKDPPPEEEPQKQ